MALWEFKEYVTPGGNSVIRTPNDAVEAALDHTLKTLAMRPDWRGAREFEHLGRDGLGAVRFKSEGVHYRAIGSFMGARQFVLWWFCGEKKRRNLDPAHFGHATKNRSAYFRNEGTLRDRIV